MSALDTPCYIDTPETVSPKSTSSSPESGTSDDVLEFEGTTIFAPPPSPTYRYMMSLKGGNLRIWLEHCETKEQWCSAKLSLKDYVDSTNAIPNATASDYVEYFHELLEGANDDVENIPIAFQRHKGDVFRLEVTVMIQVLKQSRVATYIIDMEPISLERIDILESKMRDLQGVVESLRDESEDEIANRSKKMQDLEAEVELLKRDLGHRGAEISELKKRMETLRQDNDVADTTQLTASTKVNDWICWNNYADGMVRVNTPGLYQVTAVVNYISKNTGVSIQLFKGIECIQAANCGGVEGYYSSTTLTCTSRVDILHQFSVKCPANLMGTSYLTIIRLGK